MKIRKSNQISEVLKVGLLTIPLCLAVVAAPQAFAQDEAQEGEEFVSNDSQDLDEMLRKIEAEDDGDDDVPVKIKKPKVHSKLMTTYGAKQALRWKINKVAFIDAYVDEGIGAQGNPYKTPTSKAAGGVSANYLWQGFTLSGSIDLKRNYSGTYDDWDGVLDRTFSLGAARKISLSKQWSVTPSLKQTRMISDKQTKELRKTDLVLPFSYALDKLWTVKALTLAYSTQTFTNREFDQTDRTRTISSGLAYKWSEKSSLEVSVSKEQRYSNQSSAEYSKTSVMPKYDYKFSPTSSVGIGIGYETHANSTEKFSRWILVPKLQLRWDL